MAHATRPTALRPSQPAQPPPLHLLPTAGADGRGDRPRRQRPAAERARSALPPRHRPFFCQDAINQRIRAAQRESVKTVPASPLPSTSGACCNLHGRSSPPSRPRRRAPTPCPLAQVALEPAQLRLRTASVEAPRYSRQPHGAGLVPTQLHGISPARRKRPHPRRQRTSPSRHQSPAAS